VVKGRNSGFSSYWYHVMELENTRRLIPYGAVSVMWHCRCLVSVIVISLSLTAMTVADRCLDGDDRDARGGV